jgi:hypothetical protein
LSDITTSCLDVLKPHYLNGLLPLLQVHLVDVKLHPVITQARLLIFKTLLQLGKFFPDPILVRFEETNFLAVLVVHFSLLLDLLGFPIESILFNAKPINLFLQLVVLQGDLLAQLSELLLSLVEESFFGLDFSGQIFDCGKFIF